MKQIHREEVFSIFDHTDWRDLQILSRNRLPTRSYFLPYSTYDACRTYQNIGRTHSDRVLLLNGQWQFRYFTSPKQANQFVRERFTGIKNDWDTVYVPSVWQQDGYERWHYVNVKFPFPAVPPVVPNFNPTGVYRRSFQGLSPTLRTVLCFQGVDAAFDLYCNGHYVGYSQGSHMTAEFDLSAFLSPAQEENELVVVVYKWCDGSYLECQDKFRCSGIFRDVYLIQMPYFGLWDVHIHQKRETDRRWTLNADITCLESPPRGLTLRTRLIDPQSQLIYDQEQEIGPTCRLSLPLENPTLWNAEAPELYQLYHTLLLDGKEQETIMQQVGFRAVSIQEGVFCINDVPVKLKGVNRHDMHPRRGPATTRSDLEQDVVLMKQYNVNALRTSHYPNDPQMLELCDRYGLYVIDEADLECHGTLLMREGADCIAKDPAWAAAFLDRLDRMVLRDRNHPCIIMWSLGNESGWGENHDKMAQRVPHLDPSKRPVHYQGAYPFAQKGYDVVSEMYPSLERLEQEGQNADHDPRPFFLCEYNHAMGVGPGNFVEYMQLFYRYDRLMGGCVWEWADHAVETTLANASKGYLYGGDSGEYPHDGNFCVDGLFHPDRTPSTSAIEMRQAYRPLRAEQKEDGIVLHNVMDFLDADTLQITYEITVDGISIEKKEFSLSLPPHAQTKLDLPPLPPKGEVILTLSYKEKLGRQGVAAGTFLGHDQFVLREASREYRNHPLVEPWNVCTNVDETVVTVGQTVFTFSHDLGTLISLSVCGRELLCASARNEGYGPHSFSPSIAGPRPLIWRVPTDNDIVMQQAWKDAGYDQVWTIIQSVFTKTRAHGFEFTVQGILAPPSHSALFSFTMVYQVDRAGVLTIQMELSPLQDHLPSLPRVGVIWELSESYYHLHWYGRGPHENYCDMYESAAIGQYHADARTWNDPYIRPQECGNRSDVRWVRITDQKGYGLQITADHPFHIHASPFRLRQVEQATHSFELKPEHVIEVIVDAMMSGLGSQSCGHPPQEKDLIAANNPLSFRFSIQSIAPSFPLA